MRKILLLVIFLGLISVSAGYSAEKPLEADKSYNQGVDFYNKLDYNKSADSFLQSMNTEDKKLEHWSAYNLGSAFYGQGQNAEKNDPSAANQIYQKALNFFKRAMEIDPTDKDAKYNYELTTKKIIEQQQKEKQQQDQKENQDQQKDQQQKDNNSQEQKDKQQEKNQQNKNQEQNQPNDQQKDKSEQKQGSEDQKDQDKSASQQTQTNQRQQMTEQEAKMLLENFQQAEDKKKAIELQKAQQQSSPGVKGW